MHANLRNLLAAATLLCLAGQAQAIPVLDQPGSHIAELAPASAPVGFERFCQFHPAECRFGPSAAARMPLTERRWRELRDINVAVNRAIEPVTDIELYGVVEHWAMPQDRGDCEDYVLLKRHLLMQLGWPASALLITVVRDRAGEGHAVLTVATSAGDLILDNQDEEIRHWRNTPYAYVKRQSRTDPSVWVALEDLRGPAVNQAVGGVHR